MQELPSDPAVQPDSACNIVDVGADFLAQIRDLVDECDLGRKKRIRGIFDHLRRLQRREDDRRFNEV